MYPNLIFSTLFLEFTFFILVYILLIMGAELRQSVSMVEYIKPTHNKTYHTSIILHTKDANIPYVVIYYSNLMLNIF